MSTPSSSPTESHIEGIDVSHHQGVVPWDAVAAAGISFAFAKATEGASVVDGQFATNWNGMKQAGLVRAAYHFFHPRTPIEEQVENFVNVVGAINAGDLHPILDVEEAKLHTGGGEWDAIAKPDRVPLVLSCLQEVEARSGSKPILYTRRGFVRDFLGNPGTLTDYLLWIADYRAVSSPALPTGWTTWTFWQYSQSGQVDGIAGPVDLDRFNGSRDELLTLVKGGT